MKLSFLLLSVTWHVLGVCYQKKLISHKHDLRPILVPYAFLLVAAEDEVNEWLSVPFIDFDHFNSLLIWRIVLAISPTSKLYNLFGMLFFFWFVLDLVSSLLLNAD